MKKQSVVLNVYHHVDLRCGHTGLTEVAGKRTVENLSVGEFLFFFNKASDRLKILTAGGVLVYLKSPDGKAIENTVINLLPSFFIGNRFDYSRAAKSGLEKVAA